MGIVAAVLDVVEAAAVDSGGLVPGSGAGEPVHERTVSGAVGAAVAHAAAGGPPIREKDALLTPPRVI